MRQHGFVATGLALLLAASAAAPAGAQPGSFTDPDDVNLPLDLKTLTHDDSGSTITYTAETYEAFEDRQADFKWAVDSNNDQKVDKFVSAEYEGNRLVGKVETTTEKDLGPATVERAGPAGIRVTFERRLLGGGSYQYRVISVTDQNRNEEDDPGETDVAPDTGFFGHAL